MPLRIVTGRAGGGKTKLCLDEICGFMRRGGEGAETQPCDVGAETQPCGFGAEAQPCGFGAEAKPRSVGGVETQLCDAGGALFYLVPEQANLEAECELFMRSGAEGLTHAAVVTFKRISHRVFAELGGLNRQYLNGAGKKICLSAIVENNRGDLQVLRSQSKTQGFVDDLAALFTEFKQFGLTAQNLEESAQKLDAALPETRVLRRKIAELALLYAKYCGYVEERYLDTDDDLTRLAAVAGKSALIRTSRIWIDGFDGFTEQEYDVVIEFAKYARQVTICMCCDMPGGGPAAPSLPSRILEASARREPGAPSPGMLFYPVFETIGQLAARAASEGVAVFQEPASPACGEGARGPREQAASACGEGARGPREQIARAGKEGPHPLRAGASAALSYLERYIFYNVAGLEKAPLDNNDRSVVLRECPDEYGEVEYVAAEIRALCRERGYKRGDVAVVCPDLDAYGSLIEAVFERRGLRCFIDRKKNITEHPLIRLILSAIMITESGFSYESVFSYLKTGLTDVAAPEVDELENYALSRGARGGMWTNPRLWENTGGVNLNSIRERFIGPILKFGRAMKDQGGPAAFCAAVYGLLEDCGAKKRFAEILASPAKTAQEKIRISEWARIWDFTIGILDQIAELKAGAETPGDYNYAAMFRCGAENYKIGAIPPSADEILVGSVGRTRSGKVKALFLLGANEGAFPIVRKSAALLTDDNRIALRASGLKLAKDSSSSVLDSMFNIYRTFTTPARYLSVTWPAAVSGGKTAKPSYAVKLLQKMFRSSPGPEAQAGCAGDFALKTETPQGAFENLVRELRRADADPNALDRPWAAAYDFFTVDGAWRAKLAEILPAFGFRAPGVRFSDYASARIPAPRDTSVSRLERYAACPFSYLSRYLVGALPRKVFKLEAPDFGSAVHKAIELTARKITEDGAWADIGVENRRALSDGIIELMLEEDDSGVLNSTSRNRYFKERVKETVSWGIYATANHIEDGEYAPWKHEAKFGAGGLRGAIDRIDVARTDDGIFIRVVDFKSGRRDFALSDVADGLSLQLPMYLDAALKLAERELAFGVSGGYAETGSVGPENGGILPGGMFYLEIGQPFLDLRKDGREGAAAGGLLLKQLSMNGCFFGDADLFGRTFERDIFTRGSSRVVRGISVKKDGAFTARTFAPSAADYGLISRSAALAVNKINEAMASGVYDVAPYKKAGATPCAWCGYRGACGLDIIERGGAYRLLPKRSDAAQLQALRGAFGAEGDV